MSKTADLKNIKTYIGIDPGVSGRIGIIMTKNDEITGVSAIPYGGQPFSTYGVVNPQAVYIEQVPESRSNGSWKLAIMYGYAIAVGDFIYAQNEKCIMKQVNPGGWQWFLRNDVGIVEKDPKKLSRKWLTEWAPITLGDKLHPESLNKLSQDACDAIALAFMAFAKESK